LTPFTYWNEDACCSPWDQVLTITTQFQYYFIKCEPLGIAVSAARGKSGANGEEQSSSSFQESNPGHLARMQFSDVSAPAQNKQN
jgi:hypothetical protein